MIRKEVKYYNDAGYEFGTEPIEDTIDIKKIKDGFESKYLIRDDYPDSPSVLSGGDDNLFLVHYHRDFDVRRPETIQKEEIADWYRGNKISQEEKYRIFPVSAYIHSGVSLALGKRGFGSDPGGWDTSHVGACLASRDEFEGDKRSEEACNALVDEWNTYLEGSVFCVVKDTLDKDKQVIDHDITCGFYGYDYAKKELKDFEG